MSDTSPKNLRAPHVRTNPSRDTSPKPRRKTDRFLSEAREQASSSAPVSPRRCVFRSSLRPLGPIHGDLTESARHFHVPHG